MPGSFEGVKQRRTQRCVICDGGFGLIRYYTWRTPLCSKKCVDRFRARQRSNRNWIGWLQLAAEERPANHRSAA